MQEKNGKSCFLKEIFRNITEFITCIGYTHTRKEDRWKKGGEDRMITSWSGDSRTTVLCIDSYENGVPVGRYYNPASEEGQSFQSLVQFLLKMEDTLDNLDFPKAFTVTRSFVPLTKSIHSPPEMEYRPGEKATFLIRILFRQNTSWQGCVTWLDSSREQSFRSVLELIMLLHNALEQSNEEIKNSES